MIGCRGGFENPPLQTTTSQQVPHRDHERGAPMTGAEYRSVLDTLGLTQERAARILGVHPLTSHGWATGKHRVHETAARFLRFLIAANLSASTAVDVLRIAMPRSKLDRLKRCEMRTEKVEQLLADANAPCNLRPGRKLCRSVIQTGDLAVDLDNKTVEVCGARVHVTVKEYEMLELLALRKGSTITREMFRSHLYGSMDEPGPKIIDVFISKLRKRLTNASGGKNYIETVSGRGYALRELEDKIPA